MGSLLSHIIVDSPLLQIEGNGMVSLPPEIGGLLSLKSLEVLILSAPCSFCQIRENSFTELPAEIVKLDLDELRVN